ncbi:MAG: ribokinase [Pseudomonadota bacterium]
MRVFNYGSINIDHVYRVPVFVQPGETRAVSSYQRFLGGKGANQSLALARAGASVAHVGAVDTDSEWVIDELRASGVEVDAIARIETPTGHAIIQVDDAGENCILIAAGANGCLDLESLDAVLRAADEQDWLLLQNETNQVVEAGRLAKQRGLKVAYNPAPFDADATAEMLPNLSLLIVNGSEFDALTASLGDALPSDIDLLITHGAQGAEIRADGDQLFVPARKVDVVDTTGAGDTFIGYFLASVGAGLDRVSALERATAASALCVGKAGAAVSIPSAEAVDKLLGS